MTRLGASECVHSVQEEPPFPVLLPVTSLSSAQLHRLSRSMGSYALFGVAREDPTEERRDDGHDKLEGLNTGMSRMRDSGVTLRWHVLYTADASQSHSCPLPRALYISHYRLTEAQNGRGRRCISD